MMISLTENLAHYMEIMRRKEHAAIFAFSVISAIFSQSKLNWCSVRGLELKGKWLKLAFISSLTSTCLPKSRPSYSWLNGTMEMK